MRGGTTQAANRLKTGRVRVKATRGEFDQIGKALRVVPGSLSLRATIWNMTYYQLKATPLTLICTTDERALIEGVR